MNKETKTITKKGLSDEDLIKKYESGNFDFAKLLKKVILKQTPHVHHVNK